MYVDGVQQLLDALGRLRVFGLLCRLPGPLPRTHRGVVAREVVLAQQLPDLQLDQVQQLRIVHQVHLVQEDHQVGDVDLTGQEDVLAGLRHRAVSGRDHQDRPVHLGGAGDHVLDVVRVTGTVDVGVVAGLRLILHVRRGDRQNLRRVATPVGLRRLGHLVIRLGLAHALGRLNHGHRRSQRRLTVVYVPDGANVNVRLGALECLLGHPSLSSTRVFRLVVVLESRSPAITEVHGRLTTPHAFA